MLKKEFPALADHHVHAQEICVHDQEAARRFNITPGTSRWNTPEATGYVEHIRRNNLDTIWLIYEDPRRFTAIQQAVTASGLSCQVKGYYFVRDPLHPDDKQIADLHRRGLIHGIKLHPVNDNYPLLPQYVNPTIMIARRLRLPVIFHSDDRTETLHLTSPEKQQELVQTYPEVQFVIGHGGAYANPRLVGNSPQTRAYWKTRGPLILAALKLAANNRNTFYETSVLTNAIKAKIVADFLNANPLAALKVLIGTDFPIKSAQTSSQLEALINAGLSPRQAEIVASNRLVQS